MFTLDHSVLLRELLVYRFDDGDDPFRKNKRNIDSLSIAKFTKSQYIRTITNFYLFIGRMHTRNF